MPEDLLYASYPVFRMGARGSGLDRELATKQLEELFAEWESRVQVRGAYSTAAFTADADVMFWWVARDVDDLQQLTIEFRRTHLGSLCAPVHAFLGLVQPAEFAKDHLPAFAKGEPPKKYACVYPFVRLPEWYLLDPAERGKLLREHGEGGREFPEVLANTTSAFGLGDYEWILAFEADSPDRIVQLIRRLRATEARRYTKLETPFITGIRKDVGALVGDLV
ncbi:MAG TPA: hydrogen peroxide-dependent heme synthase [Actinomycetota bacterium]|nr:hydrogen peroxide-dependent heme synthase [Actinomycetota bacterium]